jgi:hypothetical protein
MNPIEIDLIGAPGAGKTSLLRDLLFIAFNDRADVSFPSASEALISSLVEDVLPQADDISPSGTDVAALETASALPVAPRSIPTSNKESC